jgi:hypothetical protein
MGNPGLAIAPGVITQSIKWINLDHPFIPSPLRERVRVRVKS